MELLKKTTKKKKEMKWTELKTKQAPMALKLNQPPTIILQKSLPRDWPSHIEHVTTQQVAIENKKLLKKSSTLSKRLNLKMNWSMSN